MLLLERIESAYLGQAIEFVLAQFPDADSEIVHAAEWADLASAQDGASGIFPEPARIAQSQAEAAGIHRALPFRTRHVHRQNTQPVALRVFDQDGRRIKAHRLIVQHGASELRQVVALQISARVGDHGEARGMRLRESVERERRDRAYDFLLRFTGDAIALHSRPQLESRYPPCAFRSA